MPESLPRPRSELLAALEASWANPKPDRIGVDVDELRYLVAEALRGKYARGNRGRNRIAEQLGISTTTVSRALNGASDVSEATRVRVLAAFAEMHAGGE